MPFSVPRAWPQSPLGPQDRTQFPQGASRLFRELRKQDECYTRGSCSFYLVKKQVWEARRLCLRGPDKLSVLAKGGDRYTRKSKQGEQRHAGNTQGNANRWPVTGLLANGDSTKQGCKDK